MQNSMAEAASTTQDHTGAQSAKATIPILLMPLFVHLHPQVVLVIWATHRPIRAPCMAPIMAIKKPTVSVR